MATDTQKITLVTASVTAGAKLIVSIVRTVLDKETDLDSAAKAFAESVTAAIDGIA